MQKYIAFIFIFFLFPASAYADWNEMKWGTNSHDALIVLKNKATGMTKISGIEPITRIKPDTKSNGGIEQVTADSITATYHNESGDFDAYLLFDDDHLLDQIMLYSNDTQTCLKEKDALIQSYGAPIGVNETKSPWFSVNGVPVDEKDTIINFANASNNIIYKFYSGAPNQLMRKCSIIITKTEIPG